MGTEGEPEEALGGWNVGAAVRVGRTVRRRMGPWSPSIHRLLKRLESVGFEGSPRVLGIDERGREVLAFIEGDSPSSYPYPDWVWGEAALRSAALLLRRYHDTVSGWEWANETWRVDPGPEPYEVVCHNDIAPANTVFRRGRAIAMIDWDHAAPGSRAWDLAIAVWRWAPLTRSAPAGAQSRQGARAESFCEAYGFRDVRKVIELVPARIRRVYEHVRERAAVGEPGFTEIWGVNEGRGLLADADYVDEHVEDLLSGKI